MAIIAAFDALSHKDHVAIEPERLREILSQCNAAEAQGLNLIMAPLVMDDLFCGRVPSR